MIASRLNLELTPLVVETELNFNLDLPLEIKHEVDGQLLYSFTPDDFRLILKIFKNYTVLSEMHTLLLRDIRLLENENTLLILTLNNCSKTLEDVNSNREFIYKLREDELEEFVDQNRKRKIKTILFTSGGVLVGVGLGILLGVFAI